MEPSPSLLQVELLENSNNARPDTDYAVNIVVIYEDATTEQWGLEVRERVSQVAGPEAARCLAWKVSDLGRPEALQQAVAHTIRADVIVVAVNAAGELPRDVQAWINAWLPQRPQVSGILIGLLGRSRASDTRSQRTREQLCAVARKAGLDFLVEERTRRPALRPASSLRTTATVSTTAEVLYPVFDPDFVQPELRHWGINE